MRGHMITVIMDFIIFRNNIVCDQKAVKMDKEKLVAGIVSGLSDKQYYKIRQKLNTDRMHWCIGECDLQRAFKGKLDREINNFKAVARMREGIYAYEYFNICFVNNVICFILQSVAEQKVPRIAVLNSNGDNIWEQFFVQPYTDFSIGSCPDREVTCDQPYVFPNWRDVFSSERVSVWGTIFQKYIVLNEKTEKYVEDEVKNILGRQRVLGVLLRGTDYTACRPKGHPVQPEIDDVINIIREKIDKLRCDKIYLATEDSKIEQRIREYFPDKVLINKRVYYDDEFEKGKYTWIKDVHFNRVNDDYLKGLEYLSSLIILSRCDALVAGNCGGTQMAVFLNHNKYEEKYIFDLGLYS